MSIRIVVRLVFWLWFGAAVFAGQQLVLQRLPPAAGPVLIIALTALLLLAYFRLPTLHDWVNSLDLRVLALLHGTRFIGVYFLVLYHRGELPYALAIPGGIGDIVVAAVALPLVFAPFDNPFRIRAIGVWNVFGLIDLLFAVFTAARLAAASPVQMRAFTDLPLSLLPTFLVPLLLATHFVLLARLARLQRAA